MFRNLFKPAMVCAMAVMTTACFKTMGEATVSVSSNPSSIVVEALAEGGETPLADTLIITSNRSWTAKVVDPLDLSKEVDWVSLSVLEASSISNMSFDTQVILSFKENPRMRSRACEIRVRSAKGVFTIPVKQSGKEE